MLVLGLAPVAASAQSEATIDQVGTGHTLTLAQFTAGQALGAQAIVHQEDGAGAGGHLVWLDQSGGAVADIFQSGTGHLVAGLDGLSAALQTGAAELTVVQMGTDNRVFVEQAAGAYALVRQEGTGNTATILQR